LRLGGSFAGFFSEGMEGPCPLKPASAFIAGLRPARPGFFRKNQRFRLEGRILGLPFSRSMLFLGACVFAAFLVYCFFVFLFSASLCFIAPSSLSPFVAISFRLFPSCRISFCFLPFLTHFLCVFLPFCSFYEHNRKASFPASRIMLWQKKPEKKRRK
jgi:hypothetical protein